MARHIARTAGLLVGLLVLVACNDNQAELANLHNRLGTLETQNASLSAQNRVLTDQISALEKQVRDQAQQIDELSATEANLWALAQEALRAGDSATATRHLTSLLSRYPEGEHAEGARTRVASLRNEAAGSLVGEAKWYADNGQLSNAEQLYQRVLAEYPGTQAANNARIGLLNLKSLKDQEAAIRAGFLAEDVRTYWTSDSNFGGPALVVPEVRLKVRSSSGSEINYLHLMAVYFVENDGQLEQLGDDTFYVVSVTDPPLKSGVRKEVILTSTTGYVDRGTSALRFLTGDAPTTHADLYYKTDYLTDWIEFMTVDIEKRYQP